MDTLSGLPEFLQPHPYKVMCTCQGWPRAYCYGEFRDYASAAIRARLIEADTRDWNRPFTSWVVCEGERKAA